MKCLTENPNNVSNIPKKSNKWNMSRDKFKIRGKVHVISVSKNVKMKEKEDSFIEFKKMSVEYRNNQYLYCGKNSMQKRTKIASQAF